MIFLFFINLSAMDRFVEFKIQWDNPTNILNSNNFQTPIDMPFYQIYDYFWKNYNLSEDSFLFTLDNEIILMNCTPRKLGLKNNSVIQAIPCN